MFRLGKRSRGNLTGVHPDLVRLVERAIQLTPVDFVVTEGLRTKERQAELVRLGASRTMNSRHITGHAVDLAPIFEGKVSWRPALFHPLADAMKAAALEISVPVEWGGDWVSFVDMPHFQLPRKKYP